MTIDHCKSGSYKTLRRRILAVVQIILIAGALTFLGMRNPTSVSFIPPCPTHEYLGVTCPGCGSLRATHFLLTGHFMTAWHHNPALVILGIPAGMWYIASLLTMIASGRRLGLPRFVTPRVAWAVVALLCVYFAARNLPGDWGAALRPPE